MGRYAFVSQMARILYNTGTHKPAATTSRKSRIESSVYFDTSIFVCGFDSISSLPSNPRCLTISALS